MSISDRTMTRDQWRQAQHGRRFRRRLRFQVTTFVVASALLFGATIYLSVVLGR